ncbi:hypothetical protein HHK36_032757 [Tetracentron sinense]|uniref:Probable 6-phosphogluconolactonase n=1 Tax=Tetracentron sinense TaxID=13715 RepID=A0A834Y502_TETSI|nr:hypothetical protein HHK36_032757 [Tetracentron sinense]
MALYANHNNRGDLRIHDSLDELATDLADYIAELSELYMKERGVFAIALTGGSLISLMGYKCFLFLYLVPVVPSHVYSINDSVSAEEAANEYEFSLRQLVKTRTVGVSEISDCPKFDLILLGMGPDGHVASLFPNHTVLDEKDEWVTFITDSPKPPPERITFTLPVINSASNVALVVTGGSKAEAVHLAIDDLGTDCLLLPARMVQPTNGKLVWFLDKPAASKLEASQFSE